MKNGGVSPMFANSGHSRGGGRLLCLWFFVTNSLISQYFNKLVWTALYLGLPKFSSVQFSPPFSRTENWTELERTVLSSSVQSSLAVQTAELVQNTLKIVYVNRKVNLQLKNSSIV